MTYHFHWAWHRLRSTATTRAAAAATVDNNTNWLPGTDRTHVGFDILNGRYSILKSDIGPVAIFFFISTTAVGSVLFVFPIILVSTDKCIATGKKNDIIFLQNKIKD